MTARLEGRRVLGRVAQFFPQRGFGFLQELETGVQVFVHYSSLSRTTPGHRGLTPGEYVEFSVLRDATERPAARFVTGVRGGPLLCESRDAAGQLPVPVLLAPPPPPAPPAPPAPPPRSD